MKVFAFVFLILSACASAEPKRIATFGVIHDYNQGNIAVPLVDLFNTDDTAPPQKPKDEWLEAHNIARAEQDLIPLVWSPVVARSARKWALQLAEEGCAMYHDRNNKFGENLAMSWGKTHSPTAVTGWWTNEKQWYDYDSNSCMPGKACGHYTQVMWRKTRELGCAIVQCGEENKAVYVCRYNPPGNYVGQWPW